MALSLVATERYAPSAPPFLLPLYAVNRMQYGDTVTNIIKAHTRSLANIDSSIVQDK